MYKETNGSFTTVYYELADKPVAESTAQIGKKIIKEIDHHTVIEVVVRTFIAFLISVIISGCYIGYSYNETYRENIQVTPRCCSLQDYYKKHPDELRNRRESANGAGYSYKVEENTIICEYDLTDEFDTSDEEYVKSKEYLARLDEHSEKYYENHKEEWNTLSFDSGIDEGYLTMRYIFDDEIILEKNYIYHGSKYR